MTTLGAKPNHAFFHCQHPSRKKTCGAPSNASRARRESHRAGLQRPRARSAPASAGSKRNVFFKVVLLASLRSQGPCAPPRTALRTTQRRHPRKDKRIDSGIFSGGGFFAPHKPDCADLREPKTAIRAMHGASCAHRNRVDDTREDALQRIETRFGRRAFRSRRRFEASIRVVARDDITFCGRRKSRRRSRGRLRRSRSLRAHPTMRARRRSGGISARLPPAARRNRPARADR